MSQPASEARRASFYADQAVINLNIAQKAPLGNVRKRHIIAAQRFVATHQAVYISIEAIAPLQAPKMVARRGISGIVQDRYRLLCTAVVDD